MADNLYRISRVYYDALDRLLDLGFSFLRKWCKWNNLINFVEYFPLITIAPTFYMFVDLFGNKCKV